MITGGDYLSVTINVERFGGIFNNHDNSFFYKAQRCICRFYSMFKGMKIIFFDYETPFPNTNYIILKKEKKF